MIYLSPAITQVIQTTLYIIIESLVFSFIFKEYLKPPIEIAVGENLLK